MKRTLFLIKRLDFMGLIFLTTTILIISSCQKEKDEIDGTNKINESNNNYFLQEIIKSPSYFNKDSMINIHLADGIYYNLGIGRDKISGDIELPIFKPNIPLQPIIVHTVDELFTNQLIVSWDFKYNQYLTDSILSQSLKLDSCYTFSFNNHLHNGLSKRNSSIYISIILIKRFGVAQIDLNNQIINNYLSYKTSLVEGVTKDEISITPEQFKNFYGHEFASAIILGVGSATHIELSNILVPDNNKDLVLKEALNMIIRLVAENTKWDTLIENSNYLKESYITYFYNFAIPGGGSGLFFDGLKSEINSLETLYQKADFGILSKKYLPYSIIYPTFNFIQAN